MEIIERFTVMQEAMRKATEKNQAASEKLCVSIKKSNGQISKALTKNDDFRQGT